ncbi:hypothetical protein EDL99_04095 [Ornithobacterium rhinotracheale]|uniref:hypothetical protein n=1 Tax=Ornithobacterium rhinotracheale TaxID=28251 RepID=UPI00129C7C38|nr:hypothetical protein [Ornithobacterium rhinotracheale]MRJ08069.1 hypothetical protein [Ornithobacterium rhinotracheale]UOH78424.1 hypothetical protein MT996_02895 [Ornithobacterium rhinotracheale]
MVAAIPALLKVGGTVLEAKGAEASSKLGEGLLSNITSGFDDIMANGFNLRCWNAGYPPSRARKLVPADIEFILQYTGFNQSATVERYNKVLEYMYKYAATQRGVGKHCTAKGHELTEQMLMEAYNKMIARYSTTFKKVDEKFIPAGTPFDLALSWEPRSTGWLTKYDINVPIYADMNTPEAIDTALTPANEYDPTLPGYREPKQDNTMMYLLAGLGIYLLTKKK